MKNILHSAKTGEWYTPPWLVERCRSILGHIALDPASCEEANQIVQADKYFARRTRTPGYWLTAAWRGPVFLNPPGTCGEPVEDVRVTTEGEELVSVYPLCRAKVCRCNLPRKAWGKLMEEFKLGRAHKAAFIGFSVNLLMTTPSIVLSPTVLLRRRVKYLTPGGKAGKSPSHHSFVTFLGVCAHTVREHFAGHGPVVTGF